MIYFAKATKDVDECIKTGCIKIGTSDQLHPRLASIEQQIGCKIQVLGTMKGRHSVEKALHRRFRHLRCKLEWFNPGPDLLAFIAESADPWDASERSVSVRIDLRIYRRAKVIIERDGISMSEYLNAILKAKVFDDFNELTLEHLKSVGLR
jgi:hypothetical protein